ncbi:MAG TPA: CocE/NonD family hydrolase [Baekduia sp.]|nr:CocE/NonD family hydrolase [Baekduia sp.]
MYRDANQSPRPVREIRDTWIPMVDGTRLSARIWLPEDAGERPVPGILEMLPYRKSDGTALLDATNGTWFASHGYAVVRVDVRGTGNSQGVIADEYTQQELDDGVACIAWIAQQAWCTGKVGMMGLSWGGINSLQVAALQPPALHAVLSLCSTDDRYADDVHALGGALLADQKMPWATTMLALNALPPDPDVWGEDWEDLWRRRLDATPPFVKAWMGHQRRDAFLRHGSVCEDPASIRCPVFLVSGWADGFRDAVLRMLESLDVPRRGLIGPWAHAWPNSAEPGPQIGFLHEALRWWDRWLSDIPNGVEDEPFLQTWMQESVPPQAHYHNRPGRWIIEDSWPSPNVESRSLHLGVGTATLADGPTDPATVEVPEAQSHGVLGGRAYSVGRAYELPVDQRGEDALAACFDTVPLDEAVEILGVPEAELDISCDRPHALVAVRLCDVAPDGSVLLVTRGVLNLTHRDSHEHPETLKPGQRYRVRFPLHAIGQLVPKGHRIRIAVATAYWPLVWPSPEVANLALHVPGSRVHLPVRARGENASHQFAPAEQLRPFEYETVEPRETGKVTRDLVTGKLIVEYEWASGYVREELGKPVHLERQSRDEFEINDDDPLSATARSTRTIHLSRGDWQVKVVANGLLTSDAADFHVRTDVTAYHGDEKMFEREWTFTTPRDFT